MVVVEKNQCSSTTAEFVFGCSSVDCSADPESAADVGWPLDEGVQQSCSNKLLCVAFVIRETNEEEEAMTVWTYSVDLMKVLDGMVMTMAISTMSVI